MGFFASEVRVEETRKGDGKKVKIETLHKLECKICPLNHADLFTPKMLADGPKNADIYVLGEAPGEQEDRRGRPFVGPSGKLIKGAIPKQYLKRCRFNNTIRCHPPKNRNPSFFETECCRRSVEQDIAQCKPKIIIGTGEIPLKWATGLSEIGLWRGRRIAVQIGGHSCWYFPIFHPSFILRMGNEGGGGDFKRVFQDDVMNALRWADNKLTPTIETEEERLSGITCINGSRGREDVKRVKTHLKALLKKKRVGLDYETNGLRPYTKDSKLLSVALSDGRDTLSIALDHKQNKWTNGQAEEVHNLVRDFILNHKHTKIAHNLSFELEWTLMFYGVECIRPFPGCWDDTMAQAFVIDERKGRRGNGALSLDALITIHFGFNLKSVVPMDRKNIDNEPLDQVLIYNGLDAKYTQRLFVSQNIEIKRQGLQNIYNIHRRRIPTVVLSQWVGIDIDQEAVHGLQTELEEGLRLVRKTIAGNKTVKQFAKKYGEFNPASPDQVLNFFKNYVKAKELRTVTKTGAEKWSTKEAQLSLVKHPVAAAVLDFRKLQKLKSTYVDVFELGKGHCIYPDGKAHTNYNSLFVVTGRLSSDDPNCFPGDVEVLTLDGWKRFDKIGNKDQLAQYNLGNKEITFDKPKKLIKQRYTGNLINIKTDTFIDITCTPNHRFYLQNRNNKKFVVREATEYPTDFRQPQAGQYTGGNTSLRASQVILICALQADGSVTKNGDIDWGFNKKRKINRIQKALEVEQIFYRTIKQKDGRFRVVVTPPDWLKGKKVFDKWLLSYDRKTLNLFCKEFVFWDGSWTRKNEYFNNSKQSVDWVQIVYALSGRRTRLRQTKDNKRQWYCALGLNDYSMTTNHTKTEIKKHSGFVYCAEMEQHTLIVRQNGKVHITGNTQNLPARGQGAVVRRQFVPPPGHVIASFDYGQIEARVIGMASKDKAFCTALWEDYDIHAEWAEKIKKAYPRWMEDFTDKERRQESKNKFVFPSFFGAAADSVAQYLDLPPKVMHNVLEDFWDVFKDVKQWQKDAYKFYTNHGYIEGLTGRRRRGIVSWNEVINTPIQGVASDIVISAMDRLSEYAQKTGKWQFQARLNIHDDLTFALPVETLDEDIDTILEYMLNVPFTFINVPISVELAVGTDNFYEKEEVGTFKSEKYPRNF